MARKSRRSRRKKQKAYIRNNNINIAAKPGRKRSRKKGGGAGKSRALNARKKINAQIYDMPGYNGDIYNGMPYNGMPYDGNVYNGNVYDGTIYDTNSYDNMAYNDARGYIGDEYGIDIYGGDGRKSKKSYKKVDIKTVVKNSAAAVLDLFFNLFSNLKENLEDMGINPLYSAVVPLVIILLIVFANINKNTARKAALKSTQTADNTAASDDSKEAETFAFTGSKASESGDNKDDLNSSSAAYENGLESSDPAQESTKFLEGIIAQPLNEAEENKQNTQSTQSLEDTISRDELLAAKRIYRFFEEGDRDGAASFIIENTQTIEHLLNDKLNKELYVFDGDKFKKLENEHASGLVLKNGNTAFFGDFENGVPNGNATAIKAYTADSYRYDYAFGNWKDGMLDGQGTAGFAYPKHDSETTNVIREGNFVSNLMEGDVKYVNEHADQSRAEWSLTVAQGKIVLDGRWKYDEKDGVYRLIASDNANIYELKPNEVENTTWKNSLKLK